MARLITGLVAFVCLVVVGWLAIFLVLDTAYPPTPASPASDYRYGLEQEPRCPDCGGRPCINATPDDRLPWCRQGRRDP
jgi:hypothetical protein